MRVFQAEEATALLPAIRPLLAELLQARRDLAIGLLEVETATRVHGQPGNGRRATALAERVRAVQLHIIELLEKIQAHGCVVKDIDLGLVDFPTLRDGRLVNLCWKQDEPAIAFWHGMDEGFAARKPV